MIAKILLMLVLAAGVGLAAAADDPWGREYSTPETNAKVKSAIDALASGDNGWKHVFGEKLIVGPALWTRLAKADPGLARFGTTSLAEVAAGQTMEARTYKGDEVRKFLSSDSVKQLGKVFQGGKIRAATSDERHVFYNTIPYEIAGEPRAIADVNGDVLLVDFARDTAFWLDILSDYSYKP
jgi:hypothetical protein